MYEDTLFAAGPQTSDADRRRGASLSLILGVAGQGAERPTPESVRWALYDPPAQDLPADLERQRLCGRRSLPDLFQWRHRPAGLGDRDQSIRVRRPLPSTGCGGEPASRA